MTVFLLLIVFSEKGGRMERGGTSSLSLSPVQKWDTKRSRSAIYSILFPRVSETIIALNFLFQLAFYVVVISNNFVQ